jgi:hypothetical protein
MTDWNGKPARAGDDADAGAHAAFNPLRMEKGEPQARCPHRRCNTREAWRRGFDRARRAYADSAALLTPSLTGLTRARGDRHRLWNATAFIVADMLPAPAYPHLTYP